MEEMEVEIETTKEPTEPPPAASPTNVAVKEEESTETTDDKTSTETPTTAPPPPIETTTPINSVDAQNLKLNLKVYISNMYMNTKQRLPSATYPKCLRDTIYCLNNHRRAMLPSQITFEVTQTLRSTLNSQQYYKFLNILEMSLLKCEYPLVLDKLVSLLMVLNAKTLSICEMQLIYCEVIKKFYMLISSFPPCWSALRPFYLSFLDVNNQNHQSPSNKTTQTNKLKFYLELLDEAMQKCTDKELTERTSYYEEYKPQNHPCGDQENENFFLNELQDCNWESDAQHLDNFKQMSAAVQLARLFDVLTIICTVLESDLLMWLEHNKLPQSESQIYQSETCPLVMVVFGFTPAVRETEIVCLLFRLYSQGVARSLHTERLNIFERLISLVVEASNTAELKYVDNAVCYPSLGPQSRLLVDKFFKIFKAQNPTEISTYIKTIPTLSQPHMRFEFADKFLQLFHFSKKMHFSPQKVYESFREKQWRKYKPQSVIDSEELSDELSRESYMNILLNAFRDYCDWLGLHHVWKCITEKRSVAPYQADTSSPLLTPVGLVTEKVGKVFMFDEMEKEAHTWKDRINRNAIISRPRVNLPVARICMSKMSERYRNDLRYSRLTMILMSEMSTVFTDLDLTDWLQFLQRFQGNDDDDAEEQKNNNA